MLWQKGSAGAWAVLETVDRCGEEHTELLVEHTELAVLTHEYSEISELWAVNAVDRSLEARVCPSFLGILTSCSPSSLSELDFEKA